MQCVCVCVCVCGGGWEVILCLINKFRGKVCMFVCDCNNIFQACWVSIGSDMYEIYLPLSINCRDII